MSKTFGRCKFTKNSVNRAMCSACFEHGGCFWEMRKPIGARRSGRTLRNLANMTTYIIEEAPQMVVCSGFTTAYAEDLMRTWVIMARDYSDVSPIRDTNHHRTWYWGRCKVVFLSHQRIRDLLLTHKDRKVPVFGDHHDE